MDSRGTGVEQYYTQHKTSTVECCLEEHCVSSWSSYGLKQGIPGHFWFISILLILFIINISNKTYNDIGENQLSAEYIVGLVSITLCQHMDQLRPKTGNPLAIFVLSILLILCLPNVSNKFYHKKKSDQLSTQYKISTVECCLEEYCVSSWSSYGLKQGIPWIFLIDLYLLILFLINVSKKPITTQEKINYLQNT